MSAVERFVSDRATRSNLPVASTTLVGREPEVRAARERLLHSDVRLLTFTGPGGTGKTRLALEVAASLADKFADGVHFVDLAPIRDPTLVHATIGHALGILDAGDQPLLDTLRLYLQSRELLLVLDNFEQVITCAGLVSDLLAACPAVKVVVTSREPLHLSWEHEWPVPPLQLPPPTAAGDRDLTAQSPAITLFVERARASKPDFALTDENAQVVGDICVRLDGLPLAIELAAARVKLLPLAAIHARLQQRLLLLTGGPRDAPVRHHTLRAAVAWSYGLLEKEEQATFRQLAIFVGGFTLEAAEAVGILGRIEDDGRLTLSTMVDRLQSLCDKSLIRPGPSADGEPRFQMLETIREFGLEQLSANGEFEAIQERHARLFLALAEEGGRHLVERVQGVWLDRLEAEHDNVRAVLQWSLTAPEGAEIGPRLVGAISFLWYVRGHFGSGRALLDRILAREDGGAPTPRMRLKVLWAAAHLAWRQGDYEAATRLSDQGISLSERTSGRSELAGCLAIRGMVAFHQAQYANARSLLVRGLQVARDSGDERQNAWTLGFSSILACIEGDYPLARSLGEESLRILRGRGELWGIAMNLDTLGSVARRQGQYHLAQSLHEDGLAASQAIGDKWAIALSHANLGHVARALGDDVAARARYVDSLQIYREVGDRRGIALTLGNLGVLAERAGEQDRARVYLSESLATARAVGDQRVTAAALNQLARLALVTGDRSAAVDGYAKSLRLSADLDDRRGIARTLDGCASVLSAAGQPKPALELCALADELLESVGARRSPTEQTSYAELRSRIHGVPGAPRATSVDSLARGLDLHQVVGRALELLEAKPSPLPRLPAPSDADSSPLSRREREIAVLVARGLTNRAIADELVIAERTAGTHVSNILAKLSLQTRSQIAAWAVAHGLSHT